MVVASFFLTEYYSTLMGELLTLMPSSLISGSVYRLRDES